MLFLIYDMILPVLPAQTELKLSEFFTMADGERSDRPVTSYTFIFFSEGKDSNSMLWNAGLKGNMLLP